MKQVAVRRVQIAQANRAPREVTRSGHTRSPSRFRFLCAYNDYVPIADPMPIYLPTPYGPGRVGRTWTVLSHVTPYCGRRWTLVDARIDFPS